MEDSPHKLLLPDGNFIAYHKHDGKQNHVGVVFLCGFMSDMAGIKATALHKFCKSKDYPFLRFDYFGHGKSSKNFTDCNISTWLQNVLDAIDNLTSGPQIIIGSSMGGWLMMLAALARPERIAALIGIASAPDFTEDLIWDKLTTTRRKLLEEKGVYNLESEFSDSPYPITMGLIQSGRKHLLLRDKQPININCPVHLIHGLKDMDVPSSTSSRAAELITSRNITVNLVENGDHRMSTPENIDLIFKTLEESIRII